jgi:hypothetical protein
MANNYHYIIAGLPELFLNAENKGFQYEQFRAPIVEQLSQRDLKLVELLEEGLNADNLSEEFYAKVFSSKRGENRFLRFLFAMDLAIRERIVEFVSPQNAEQYLVKHSQVEEPSEEFKAQLNSTLAMTNIIERELSLDRLKWEEINNYLTFEYFTINNILAILAKAKIIDRWSNLDRAAGMELFRKFVDEVRGTFKGINNKENIN